MLLYVVFSLLSGALAASKQTDGTVACDPALRPVVITEPGTEITSPNFNASNPTQYPPNQQCDYYIQALGLPDSQVAMVFGDFVLEECIDCGCDYVEIYAGADDTAPLVGRYCGNQESLEFNLGDDAFVRFVSDGSTEGFGFSATIDYGGSACEGGSIVTAPSGSVNSPNFPSAYPNNAACEWRFILPNSSYVVELNFVEFNIEAGCAGGTGTVWDDVTFEGCTGSECLTYGVWHGDYSANMAATTFSSYGGEDSVTLSFSSDSSVPDFGWNATYQIVMPR